MLADRVRAPFRFSSSGEAKDAHDALDALLALLEMETEIARAVEFDLSLARTPAAKANQELEGYHLTLSRLIQERDALAERLSHYELPDDFPGPFVSALSTETAKQSTPKSSSSGCGREEQQ